MLFLRNGKEEENGDEEGRVVEPVRAARTLSDVCAGMAWIASVE